MRVLLISAMAEVSGVSINIMCDALHHSGQLVSEDQKLDILDKLLQPPARLAEATTIVDLR